MNRQRTGREHIAAEAAARNALLLFRGVSGSREWVEKRADEQAAVATLWRALAVRPKHRKNLAAT
jgi:hypothetical protein